MARPNVISYVPNLIAVAGLSFVVFLLLAPNVEESRLESRRLRAYYDVCRLAQQYEANPARTPVPAKVAPGAAEQTPSKVELPDKDPWERPYFVVSVRDGGQTRLRVCSSGANTSSPKSSFDEDDIYSDMPIPPLEQIMADKRHQLCVAGAVGMLTWALLTALVIWDHRRRTRASTVRREEPTT
ncbi:MAG: hypothetical protein ACYC35_17865 [Pirellulales bacterium]